MAGFCRGDERTESPAHLDDFLLNQGPVGMLDRIGVQLQLGRELPRGGERFSGFQNTDGHGPMDLVRDLPVHRPGVVRPQLEQHDSELVY